MNNIDYTKKIKLIEFKINNYVNNILQGKYKTKLLGSGLEIINIREYNNSNDNYKNIEWKTTAKKGKKHTKEYMEERNIKFTILLDNSFYLKDYNKKIFKISFIGNILNKVLDKKEIERYGIKEKIVEDIIIFLGILANKDNNSYGCFYPNKNIVSSIKHKKDKKNIINIIKSWKNSKINKKDDFIVLKNLLKQVIKLGYKNQIIFIITDRLNHKDWGKEEKILKCLSNHNNVFIISPLYTFEKDLLCLKNNFKEKDNKNKKINIKIKKIGNPINNNLLIKKNKKIQENYNLTKKIFQKNKIKNILIDKNTDIVKEILSSFKKKE